MSESNAANIKAAILAAKKPKFIIKEWAGQKIEVRQPTWNGMLDRVNTNRDESDKARSVRAIVEMCFVPGTQDRIFSMEDMNDLLEIGWDDELRDIQQACMELMGISPDEIEDAAKNSGKAQSGGTSS